MRRTTQSASGRYRACTRREYLSKTCDEMFEVDRLCEMSIEPSGECSLRIRSHGVCGERDRGNLASGRAELANEAKPILTGHRDVTNDHRRDPGHELITRRCSGSRGVHHRTSATEEEGE